MTVSGNKRRGGREGGREGERERAYFEMWNCHAKLDLQIGSSPQAVA
jgi:hypothetical protein